MAREREEPTRGEGGQHDDYIEEHPAYATIAASRGSHGPGARGGETLFGSDMRHQHSMTVTIRKASLRRGLSSDHIYGHTQLIEVELTESQWATFVSTPNMGTGTPCTLRWYQGPVPGIVALDTETDRHNAEVDGHLKEAQEAIANLLVAIEKGKGKTELRSLAWQAQNAVGANLRFVADRFAEHTEETVEKAKTEVEAYINAAIQRAGLQALGAAPILELEPEREGD